MRCNGTVPTDTLASPVSLRRRLITEPARPARIRRSPRAAWYVVGAVSVGAFMGQLDASIVTVALPRIGERLHADVGATEWVSLSYLLVLVCTLVPVGHLADRIGRKLLYVYGFAVFTGGSMLCAVAPTLGWLVAARVVQALGAAMLQANSVALIREAVPPHALGRGIGLQGTAQAVGLALGPAVGGALLALGSWRLLFLVNVPAGCLGIALGWLLLPRSAGRADARPALRGSDRLGGALIAVCAGDALLALSLVGRINALALAALVLAAVVAGFAFVRREARAAAPLVDLALLRRPVIAVGLSSGLVSYGVMFGALFVVPYYLAALHVSPAIVGAQLVALPAALAVVAPFAGRVSDARGGRLISAAGMLLAAAGLLLVAADHAPASRVGGLALAGAGLGAFMPANNAAIMGAAPDGRAGVVSGMLNVTRALGTALGIAVTTAVYASVRDSTASASGVSPIASGHGLTAALGVWAAVAAATGMWLLWARRAAEARAAIGERAPAAARDDARPTPDAGAASG